MPETLLNFLNENGVESRIYYPIPLHLQECYKELGYKKGDFPETEANALINIPLQGYHLSILCGVPLLLTVCAIIYSYKYFKIDEN